MYAHIVMSCFFLKISYSFLILAKTFIEYMFGICLIAESTSKSPSIATFMWQTLNPTLKPSFEASSQPSDKIINNKKELQRIKTTLSTAVIYKKNIIYFCLKLKCW